MMQGVKRLEHYEMAAGIRILWRRHACGRLPLPARSETVPPQSTAIPIRPERIPARSPHQPTHSFDFD